MDISSDLQVEKKSFLFSALLVATFFVTFQAYLVAPLLPELATDLHAGKRLLGFAIPAFAIPYGLTALFSTYIADKIGGGKIVVAVLSLMCAGLFLISFAWSGITFLGGRVFMGVACGGIVPLSMSVVSDLYPYGKRDKPFNFLALSLAGGMTFGPTIGAWFYPVFGWRPQFILIGVLCCLLFTEITGHLEWFPTAPKHKQITIKDVFRRVSVVLRSKEGQKVYGFIFLNGVFHSGLFVWISFYFSQTYNFNDRGTGLALLVFSLPGLLMAVCIRSATDKFGKWKIIISGLFTITATIVILIIRGPFWLSFIAVALLSLGYAMTQPLFAGVFNNLRNGKIRGVTLGLGVCLLFMGYGTGPIIFQYMLGFGIEHAVILLLLLEFCLAFLSFEGKKN